MSIHIASRAGLLLSALPLPLPSPRVPPLFSPRLLDLGVFGGAVVAMADPNWVGVSGLVVAVGSVVVKVFENWSGIKTLEAQNASQAAQIVDANHRIDALIASVGLVEGRAAHVAADLVKRDVAMALAVATTSAASTIGGPSLDAPRPDS